MEMINQVTSTQFLLPAIAVAGVLICAVLVFVFGFKSAEEPQFDKLPLVIDDRKASSKKRKTKEKKSSGQEGKKNEAAKKSPAKEKKEQKQEKQKPKEKVEEVKKTPTKKEAPAKKPKQEKPVDFDDGEWEKVPSKGEKKKKNQEEGKKDSPVKDKKKGKKEETEVETKKVIPVAVPSSAPVKENVAVIDKEIQEKINELQRALNAMEEKERAGTPVNMKAAPAASNAASTNKKPTEEQGPTKKENVKKADDFVPPPAANDGGVAFDELGDSWTDAKAPKKNKKKVRKE